jgi:NAD(P)-dependent dehydrogenase (short-subunit alcohol dehydrogenase family)
VTGEATTAVVTGAARGIGREIARTLRLAGHRIVAVDLGDGADAVAAELGGVAVRADVAAASGRRAIAAAAGGRVAVLVNNAGITRDALIANLDEDAFRAVVRVNLGAAYALTTELAPAMAGGGAVVNLSSRAQLGNVGQYNYAVSKAGIVGLTRALALQLAPRLRVNAVAPGFVATEMTAAMPERVRDRIVGRVPLQRAGEAQDIADAVAWLASPRSAYVTGQVQYVCGGRAYG